MTMVVPRSNDQRQNLFCQFQSFIECTTVGNGTVGGVRVGEGRKMGGKGGESLAEMECSAPPVKSTRTTWRTTYHWFNLHRRIKSCIHHLQCRKPGLNLHKTHSKEVTRFLIIFKSTLSAPKCFIGLIFIKFCPYISFSLTKKY